MLHKGESKEELSCRSFLKLGFVGISGGACSSFRLASARTTTKTMKTTTSS